MKCINTKRNTKCGATISEEENTKCGTTIFEEEKTRLDGLSSQFLCLDEIDEMAVNAQSVRLFPPMLLFRCVPQMFIDIFQDNEQRLENSKDN